MKPILLFGLFSLSALCVKSQDVTTLLPGTYETKTKVAQNRWEKGDMIILDDSRYRLTGSTEVGEYRFSVAAQRIFFTSGPLKSAFTKVILSNNKPAVVFPKEQNQELGLTAEVWASKQ